MIIIWKFPGNLWQHYRDKPRFNNPGVATDFPNDINSSLLKFKQKRTAQPRDDGKKDVKTIMPLKYLSNLWITP